MSEITYYLCGGTGINIGLALKKGTKTLENKNAKMIGLDSSDRNDSSGQFEIVRMEGTFGSGKDLSLNFDAMIPFIDKVMVDHKPTKYNVIISSAAGGTGPGLAILTARKLIKADQLVVLCLISDHTTLTEKENSVNGLQTFANQVAPNQLNAPICYLDFINEPGKTRGETNEEIVGGLNLLSMFLSSENEEMDYQDVKRVFNYSARGKINPALSRIVFYTQKTAPEFEGKPPVSVASLFKTSDEITPMFIGSAYRTTGVFGPNANLPKETSQLHLTLDHGDALAALVKEIESVNDDKAKASSTYSKQKDVSAGANDLGVMF